jgi:hypothetical protein
MQVTTKPQVLHMNAPFFLSVPLKLNANVPHAECLRKMRNTSESPDMMVSLAAGWPGYQPVEK